MPTQKRAVLAVYGEAYSLDQGRMEGALRTAETVRAQCFQPLPLANHVNRRKAHG